MVNINEKYKEHAERLLFSVLFILFSLYVINVVGNIDGVSEFLGKRRYLNALWIVLVLYLVVSRGKIKWQFFWENVCLIIPISVASLFLYFYHNHIFDLSYIKYAFLLILVGSIICKNNKFKLREFFVVNSLACLIIFFSAIYQILILKYSIPNGDLNQNIFACFVVAIGNVSFFAVLYKNLNKFDRVFFAICGILAIWVALRTTCRTAYVTEVIVAGLFSYFAHKRLECSRQRIIGFFALVVVSLLLVVVASPSITEYKFKAIFSEISGFVGLGDKETTSSSVGLRLAMWKAAIFDVIPKHWCFGIGDIRKLDWLSLLTGSNIDREFLKAMAHFHNEGINILVMGGLLLFIVSNWLLYRLFVIAKSEPVQLCLLVGTVVWGMTEVAFRHKPFLVVFLSIWLLYECAIRNEQYQETEEGSVFVKYWYGFGAFTVVCYGFAKKLMSLTRNKLANLQSEAICKSLQVLSTLVKLPLGKILALQSPENNPQKILVVGATYKGDVQHLMLALSLLRKLYPYAEISVLLPNNLCDSLKRGETAFIPIFYDEKSVSLNLKLWLKTGFYDEVYVFWNKQELLLTQAIGAKRVITYEAFKRGIYKFLANDFYKVPDENNLEDYFVKLIIAKEGTWASETLKTLHSSQEESIANSSKHT